MSKERATKKEMKENYKYIISVSFCNLQTLLSCEDAFCYSDRAEGWACDYYKIDNNTIISTGYAPMGNIKASYDYCKYYEQLASKICNDRRIKKFETKKAKLNELIQAFGEQARTTKFKPRF